MKKPLLVAALLSSAGCTHTSVTPLVSHEPFYSTCPVTTFTDMDSARAKGEIVEESCVVTAEGPSTTEAIKEATKRVCCCGTNFAVIKMVENPSFFKTANAIVVGVRFKDQKDNPGKDPYASRADRSDIWYQKREQAFCQ